MMKVSITVNLKDGTQQILTMESFNLDTVSSLIEKLLECKEVSSAMIIVPNPNN